MKKTTIESCIEFDWIGDHQMSAVIDIADACFAEIGMNAIGGSRLPQWKMGLPLWDKAVLTRYPDTNHPDVALASNGSALTARVLQTPTTE